MAVRRGFKTDLWGEGFSVKTKEMKGIHYVITGGEQSDGRPQACGGWRSENEACGCLLVSCRIGKYRGGGRGEGVRGVLFLKRSYIFLSISPEKYKLILSNS